MIRTEASDVRPQSRSQRRNTQLYDFEEILNSAPPHEEIPLFSGPAILTDGSVEHSCSCRIAYKWLPAPRCVVDAKVKPLPVAEVLRASQSDGPHLLKVTGATSRLCISKASYSSSRPFPLCGSLNGPLEISSPESINVVRFAVPNLENYCDLHARTPTSAPGYHEWASDNWRLHLEPLDDVEARRQEISRIGYALTHRGHLEMADQSGFTNQDAKDALNCARMALTFIRAKFTPIMFPTGFESEGQARSYCLAPWLLDPGQSALTWADQHHSSNLGEIWAGFLRISGERGLSRILNHCVHCYVESSTNRGSALEHCIVVSQIALEMLSWHHLVDGQNLTKTQYEKLSAAERFQRLLSDCGIPDDIPSHFSELGKCSGSQIGAVVRVRNDIVHPKPRSSVLGDNHTLLVEAWLSGVWALELVLLSKLGYRGKYRDRRRISSNVGEVEDLPWS